MTRCRSKISRYTSHFVVEALSVYKNGNVRQHGSPKRISWLAPMPMDATT